MKVTEINGNTNIEELSVEAKIFFTWWDEVATKKEKKEVIEIIRAEEPGCKSTFKIIKALDEFCINNK